MELEELGLDENLKIMPRTAEDPIFDYDTIHGLTWSLHGADRNCGGRTAGRVVHRVGRTQGRAPDREDQTPFRSVVQVPVNLYGLSANRRRPREPKVDSPHKQRDVEVAAASETPIVGSDVPILDSPSWDSTPFIPWTSPLDAAISSIGTALGSISSMRHRIYEILSAPNFLSDLGPRIFSRNHEWNEKKEVTLYTAIIYQFVCRFNFFADIGSLGSIPVSLYSTSSLNHFPC